jgi:hypothetical protein
MISSVFSSWIINDFTNICMQFLHQKVATTACFIQEEPSAEPRDVRFVISDS